MSAGLSSSNNGLSSSNKGLSPSNNGLSPSNKAFKLPFIDDLVLHIYMTFVHPAKDFKNPAIYLHHIFGLITFPFSAVGLG